MKKDDAIAIRERLAVAGVKAAAKAGYDLEDDGKLRHDEVGDLSRWALRMAPASSWPHRPDLPGLRFEAWFFAGKPRPEEEVLLMLVLAGEDLPPALAQAMAPAFEELVQGGKFARRYRPVDNTVTRFYPRAIGIVKHAPTVISKLEAAWIQLVSDAYKPVQAALRTWDPDGKLLKHVAATNAQDPFEALGRKFSK
jgi:hypothetical protein